MPLELFPYQEEGANWLSPRARAGLFDEMGIGKSAQAIRACDNLHAFRIVVVCPAMLRENWRNEFNKFARLPRRICKGVTKHDYAAWAKNSFDVLITGYEMIVRWKEWFDREGQMIDVLIVDESHYVKTPGTQRTKALLGPHLDGIKGIASKAAHTYMLTGTPMANDPSDIFPHLKLCGIWRDTESAFLARYFYKREGTYGNRYTPRSDMIPELQQMIASCTLRRTKKDVGLQIPPIFMTSMFVDGNSKELADLLAEHVNAESIVMHAAENGGLGQLTDIIEWVSTLRRLLGSAKAVPYSVALLEELKVYGGKRVVFGIHTEALNYVHAMCAHGDVQSVLVTGRTPEKDRVAAVEAFMSDERCQVFIGNSRAAGTGLTLTSSFEVDIMESAWDPATNAQAIMRVHRIGQTQNVRARFITLANTFDVKVNEIVARKTADIAMIDTAAMNAAPPVSEVA